MANSPSFVQYTLDLLSPIAPVTARSMFGGHGLYSDGVMFGLLDDGEIFFRTDDETRATFLGAGCKMWVYPSPKGPMQTSNFRPPPAAMENSDAMRPWFELALAAGRRKAAGKSKRVKKAAPVAKKAAPVAKKASSVAKGAPVAKRKATKKVKPPSKKRARE